MTNSFNSKESITFKNILAMYPGAVFYGLLFNISLMIDSILAGHSLGSSGIAAVALGVPGYGVLAAVIYSLIHGSGLRMIWAKGRADHQGFQRAFHGGATLVGITGLVFAILILLFADSIVLICGGDMVEPFIRDSATVYLCFCAPVVFFTALGMVLQEAMNVMGFQNARAALGAINVIVNLIVSIISVYLLPADIKLAGLGIGTSAGGLVEFLAGVIILRIKNCRLGYRPLLLRPKEILETIRCGFPAAADYFAENIVMGVQNNLILSGFPGDAMILATSEIVCNLSYFASGTIKGAAIATEPLFGVFYEEHDINSIKKVWQQGWILGAVMSVVWAIIFYFSTPVFSSLCGMEMSPDISRGVFLCMIFAPVMHTVYMFTLYYEATKRFNLSMAFAIIPDSCLYVIIMAILIPIIGKDGIWLAVTGNQVVGLIFLIPCVLVLAAISGIKKDRLLLLPKEFYSETLIMESELSTHSTEKTAEQEILKYILQLFPSDIVQNDTTGTCPEELALFICQNSKGIHIKLMDNSGKKELFIRSLGQPWDLPAPILEKTNAIENVFSVSHSYVYNMNIVRITY